MRFVSRFQVCVAGILAGCSLGPATTEVEGVRFELLERPDPASLARTTDRAEPVVRGPVAPLHEMDHEALALALRPVIYDGSGQSFVAAAPAWEQADRVLADAESSGNEYEVDWVAHDRAESMDGRVGLRVEPAIIGADGRNRVNPTTVDPFQAMVRLELFNGSTFVGHCSGSFIGPWTVLTAAHCILLDGYPLTNRIVFKRAQNGPLGLPFGQQDCRNDDANPNNDILIGMMAGWTGNFGAQTAFDVAVIDTFPCMSSPAFGTFDGYLVNSGTATYHGYGYPGDICPGAPTSDTFLCGMSGSAYINAHMIETEHIDTFNGQSGGPWYRFTSSNRVAGPLNGYREYFDLGRCGFDVCRRNFVRRIDSTVDTFIRAISFDF